MSEKLKKCEACDEHFQWKDDVIVVNDEIYHKDCLTIFPMSYFAMLDDNPLGETDNEDGSMAIEILDEGEYMEDDE